MSKLWVKTRNLPRDVQVTLREYELDSTEPLERTRKYLADGAKILVLAGGVGTGKSLAAASAVLDGPPGSRWITSWELSTVSIYDDKDADFEVLKQAPVLAIDDLGVEYGDRKGYFDALLDGLLSYRIAYGWQTIITCNIQPKDLEGRLGARLADRIRESGHVVLFGSQSMRGKVRPTKLKVQPESGPFGDVEMNPITPEFVGAEIQAFFERNGEDKKAKAMMHVVSGVQPSKTGESEQ